MVCLFFYCMVFVSFEEGDSQKRKASQVTDHKDLCLKSVLGAKGLSFPMLYWDVEILVESPS